MIYLDWAATAIPQKEIIIEANKKACEFFANPSSHHRGGKDSRGVLENSRNAIAKLLGVNPSSLFFSSGGTESNHIALLSMLNSKTEYSIAISSIEHSSLREQAKVLEKNGCKILKIPVNKDGIITPEAVLNTIKNDTAFVSVMTVNNETGVIQPIREIGLALRKIREGKKPIFFHTDMVQAIGKIPINLSDLPVDSASFSGHKIGAPRGIGFLYLAKSLDAFVRGGGQEANIRPGTENLAGILALEGALKNYIFNQKEYFKKATSLMSLLIEELRGVEGVTLIPSIRSKKLEQTNPVNFSPWIMQFATNSLPGEVLLRCLSEKGIYISTGSACSAKKKTNPVIEALQVDPKIQKNIVRISIGPTTSSDDIKAFIGALKKVISEF